MRCYEAVHGTNEPPEFRPHAQTCQDHREHTAEVHEPRLGGDYLVSTTPQFNSEGQFTGAVHIARDISERKRAEEALRDSERRLRTLGDQIPGGAIYQHLRRPDGRVSYAAPRRYRESHRPFSRACDGRS